MLFAFEEDAMVAGGSNSVTGTSAEVRAWCAEQDGKCCSGIDSCLFAGEATVSLNACNGDREWRARSMRFGARTFCAWDVLC